METKEMLAAVEKLRVSARTQIHSMSSPGVMGVCADERFENLCNILEALIKRDAERQLKTATGNPFITDAHSLLMRIGKVGSIMPGTFLEKDIKDYYDRHKDRPERDNAGQGED